MTPIFLGEIVKPASQNKTNSFSSVRDGFCALCLVIFLFASNISGKTLKEYKEHIGHLKSDFASIMAADERSEKEKALFDREVFEEASKLLPPKDKIEVDGQTIEVNNEWLAKKITNYRNETKNPERKLAIVEEIYERLEAIEIKLKELETASSSATKKDENKRKISEILSREEYGKPANEETLIERWWREFGEWLKSIFPKPEIQPAAPGGFQSIIYVVQIVLYILVAGLIGFLIYKFAPLIFKRLRGNLKVDKGERIILGEKLLPSETSETLFGDAERLAREGNLKAAIRKGYIALLFELSERKVLGLAKHKTNRDYLLDVKKEKGLYRDMNNVTSNYERHWYGFESVNEGDWEEFKKGYNAAVGYKR